MKRVLILIWCLIWVSVHSTEALFAQEVIAPDTAFTVQNKKRDLNNTIWFNLTNPVLLSDNSLIFGFERIIFPNQSVTVNFGVTSLPDISLADVNVDDENFQLHKNTVDHGYNGSIDYRFYLAKLNKYSAPRGVYLAPYYSYNYFGRKNTWTLDTDNFHGDVDVNFSLDIHTIGGELGYQFVFWRRLALDFVLFGPGMARYQVKAKLSTTLDADDQAELLQIINDKLAEKIPGYEMVIDDAEFEKTGTAKTTTLGFRYMIHMGFRF